MNPGCPIGRRLLRAHARSLLDEFVDAFAAGDAGGVFACVDKVIEVGQDRGDSPRTCVAAPGPRDRRRGARCADLRARRRGC